MSTTINVSVINKSSNELPKYAHKGDAGFDLRANVEEIKMIIICLMLLDLMLLQ